MNSVVVAFIPARSGSKGVPGKNIKKLLGKPLIGYTLDAAKASKLLTHVYTTSDDKRILNIAKKYGSELILRPKELAEDATPMVPVLQHAVQSVEKAIGKVDFLVLLQPTTPLRTGDDVDDAITLLNETGADSVISFAQVGDSHPARMYSIEEDHKVKPLWGDEFKYKRRQDLPKLYLRNGMIYACKRDVLMEQNTLEGKDTRGLVIPSERCVNIDEPIDFEVAKILLKRQQK